MANLLFVEVGNTLAVFLSNGEKRIYKLFKGKVGVSSQQYYLPEGQKIVYSDGAMMIHRGNYALFRNWNINGQIVDRIAIRYSDLHLVC